MRLRMILTLLIALISAGLAGASLAPASKAAGPAPIASESGPISDEQSTTYWAYAVMAAPVRSAPNARARVIDSVHLNTEDGFPEDYLVLAQEVYPHLTWFEVRLPGRPNGRTGWVSERALGALHITHLHAVVDEQRLRLTLYRRGRQVFSAPIGVGKPSTPTPRGNFWIREKFRVRADPFYGEYAFGTADYSTLSEWPHGGVVGIHGTSEPSLIPGMPSHGCVRLRDADVARLWSLLPVGTPLTIR
jgi:lipoprotein-anchoring transpeptidase ErfK/SrfK